MDIVLLSARGAGTASHWSAAAAAALAGALRAAGDVVHWLCAAGPQEPAPPAPSGIEQTVVRGSVPPFRRVARRAADPAFDQVLARRLRSRPADLVVHVGFGAAGSLVAPWLADRMGARAAAVVRAEEVVCYRGTLIHASGAQCTSFDDPMRCARCCCAAAPGGLSRPAALLARVLRPLGALAPFPRPSSFLDRADYVFGSLLACQVILVGAERDRDLLAAAAVPQRSVAVVPGLGGMAGAAAAAAILRSPPGLPQ